MGTIHPTAIIDPQAQLGDGVTVGPYTIVGPDVVAGEGCVIHNHVTLTGYTTLGKGVQVFPGAVVGGVTPLTSVTTNAGGSTVLTGLGYLFYEGEHRSQHAACMIETWSSPFAYRPDGALRVVRRDLFWINSQNRLEIF